MNWSELFKGFVYSGISKRVNTLLRRSSILPFDENVAKSHPQFLKKFFITAVGTTVKNQTESPHDISPNNIS